MALFARKCTGLLLQVFRAEAFNWSLQEGKRAGQTVEHLHWHIVPRYKDDLPQPGDWYPLVEQNENLLLESEFRPRLSEEQLKEIVRHIRQLADRE